MFKLGDKVICIKPFTGRIATGRNKGAVCRTLPVKGGEYTVKAFSEYKSFLELEELPRDELGGIPAYNPSHFRKILYSGTEEYLEEFKEDFVDLVA